MFQLISRGLRGTPLTMHHCIAEFQTALIKALLAVGAQVDVTGAAVIGRRRGMSPCISGQDCILH